MNPKEEKKNSKDFKETYSSSLDEQSDSVNFIEAKVNSEEINVKDKKNTTKDYYKFGWSYYSEITNGRFAMIGFLAIIIIELATKQSFLKWTGLYN